MDSAGISSQNNALEESLKKMVIKTTPFKFFLLSFILIMLIVTSVIFSGTLNSKEKGFKTDIDIANVASGNITVPIDLSWCAGDSKGYAYFYLGEKSEFFDNHAAIKLSFSPDQITTFSLLGSGDTSCGSMTTFKQFSDFLGVKIEDNLKDGNGFLSSNNVKIAFSSTDETTEAYPCGYRSIPIYSVPFHLFDPNDKLIYLESEDLSWNEEEDMIKDFSKVNWIQAPKGHIINSLRTSPLGYGVKYMGKYNCKNSAGKYKFVIPEEFLTRKMGFNIYRNLELQVRSNDMLSSAPLSYLIFSVVNIAVISIVMGCVFCKRKQFFISPGNERMNGTARN